MRQYIFEKNTPSLEYISNRWPRSLSILSKYSMSNYKKPDLFKLSLACLKGLNFHQKTPLTRSIRELSLICSKNFNSNKYHDQHHFKAVLLIASVFAKVSKLKKIDNLLIVILSLTHDMSHQGRRIINRPYYQEKKTIKNLERIIFRKILNQKSWKRIKRILLNTYFPIIPKTSNDIVEKIILNADLASSMIFGEKNGLILARRLKNEINIEDKSTDLYSKFKGNLDKRDLRMLNHNL